ncbi:hypothetical protein LCGC14_0439050 [marine sediment metagenome]|uniref:Uncharacterized protein n=1 Tax=marine sediment metagenome TaxID=412755 RepID=A0A0F9T406_9ZZZZ
MIDMIVNLFRYFMGERHYDHWNKSQMFYVLTKSGNFADWLHIRRQMRFRRNE